MLFNTANGSTHLLCVWSYANDPISLSLSFAVCNMKGLDFTRGGHLLRWKCKLSHLFCLMKHFQVRTNLWKKNVTAYLLLLSNLNFPTQSSSFPLFYSVFFHLLVQYNRCPKFSGTGELRLILINLGGCGFRKGEGGVPLDEASTQ